MNLEIIPGERAGSLYLGMTQTQIREVMNSSFKERPPARDADYWEDIFAGQGIRVCYDSDPSEKRCICIEIWEPSKPILQGHNLLSGNSVDSLSSWLKTLDPDIETGYDGILSQKLGLYIHTEERAIYELQEDYNFDDDDNDDDEELITVIFSVSIFKEPYVISL